MITVLWDALSQPQITGNLNEASCTTLASILQVSRPVQPDQILVQLSQVSSSLHSLNVISLLTSCPNKSPVTQTPGTLPLLGRNNNLRSLSTEEIISHYMIPRTRAIILRQ